MDQRYFAYFAIWDIEAQLRTKYSAMSGSTGFFLTSALYQSFTYLLTQLLKDEDSCMRRTVSRIDCYFF